MRGDEGRDPGGRGEEAGKSQTGEGERKKAEKRRRETAGQVEREEVRERRCDSRDKPGEHTFCQKRAQ